MTRTRSGKVYSIAPAPAPVPVPAPAAPEPKENPLSDQVNKGLSILSYLLYRMKMVEDVNDKLNFCSIAESVILSGGSATVGHVSGFGETALMWVIVELGLFSEKMLADAEWALLHKNLTKLAHSIITHATDATEFEQRNRNGVSPFFWTLFKAQRPAPVKTRKSLYSIAHHILRKYAKKRWSIGNLELMWSPLRDCKTGRKYTTTTLMTPYMRNVIGSKCVV